jgi:hypothetical protein
LDDLGFDFRFGAGVKAAKGVFFVKE